MEYPPNDDNQPYFAMPTNESNTYYPHHQPDTDYPLHQPGTSPYQPPQAPIPPTPPKKKTKGWHILLAIIVFWVVVMICIFSAQSCTSVSSLGSLDATATAGATEQPTTSIPDQLQTALPSLQSDWIMTESDGDVVLSLRVSDPITVDTTLKAKNLIITQEQHVWQAGVDGIHIVTISIAGTDANGVAQDVAKATVTEQTANVIQWDSLTPTQVWGQFDKTWVLGQGDEYGN